MRRFSEGQIIKIFRETDRSPMPEVTKKNWDCEQSIYTWRKRYGVLDAYVVNAKIHGFTPVSYENCG